MTRRQTSPASLGESTRELVVRRTYEHPPSRVFAAFSSAHALERWLAPDAGIGTEVLEFEFRVGLGFRIAFKLPDGSTSILGGVYQRIERAERLEFTWRWEPPDPHAGVNSLVSVSFVEGAAAATTEVVVRHGRLDDATGMRPRHLDGWVATLTRLAQFLGDRPATLTDEDDRSTES